MRTILCIHHLRSLVGVAIALALLVPFGHPASAAPAAANALINEFVFNHVGSDAYEYIEVLGGATTDYSNLSLLGIEGDGSGAGVIDNVIPLGTTDASGYWVTPYMSNVIENGTVTILLVQDFAGSAGLDLDTDNNGVLDSAPWTTVLDDVAVSDGGSGDLVYGGTVLEPFYDGMDYAPGGASRIPDGTDTDSPSDWVRNDFDLAGIPDNDGTPSCGEAMNTPGAPNEVAFPAPPVTLSIPEIQGAGQVSPYDGVFVETEGVVTMFNASGSSFWMQDPTGDGNSGTSDGVFVSGGGYPVFGPKAQAGDMVRLTAFVDESQYGNELPLTRLQSVCLLEVLSSGNALPPSVPLIDLPNVSIAEGIAFWEPLEGMLVSVENAVVVAPTSAYGEFSMLTQTDAASFSGYRRLSSQLFVRSLGGENVDYNPERITADDYSLDEAIVVRPGDQVHFLEGALDYTFGVYKIQPLEWDITSRELPEAPVSTRFGGMGDTRITTFNVENLFDLEAERGVVVDAIGQLGFDPGTEWGTGLVSTADNTIRRKDAVCVGDADAGDPFDPSVEWGGFAKDTVDGLGSHATACGVASGLFFSEYIEGSSYNKAVEIYNGTGAPVDLGAAQYAIEINFNGSAAPGNVILLSGIVPDGGVYVVAHNQAAAEILAQADLTTSYLSFNGDDTVLLRRGVKDDASSTPTLEQLETKLTKLALAIQVELELPGILIVQEVENTAILQVLGERVNAATGGSTAYTAVSFEASDARGIEVGFLWDANQVSLLNAYQLSGPDVEAAFGPASESPGREPIVGVFSVGGRQVTIVGNHFKSKGGDDPIFGVNWPPLRFTETQRKAQARVVRDFVNSLLSTNPHTLVMVAGDLNDFQFAEPGEGRAHPIAILEGGPGEVRLIDLIDLETPSDKFTYVYDGNSQVLDHILVSPAMLLYTRGVDVLHFNASFPDGLVSDASTPLRCADHDPIEARFQFSWRVTPWSVTRGEE